MPLAIIATDNNTWNGAGIYIWLAGMALIIKFQNIGMSVLHQKIGGNKTKIEESYYSKRTHQKRGNILAVVRVAVCKKKVAVHT